MSGLHRGWRWRGTFGDVEVELYPDSVDVEAREETRSQLRQLIDDFKYRDPESRRVVLEIHAELNGLSRGGVRKGTFDFDLGSPSAEEFAEPLLRAAAGGRLVARPRKTSPALVGLDVEAESVLGPESAKEVPASSTSWIGLVLTDQTGAPVAGRRYRVVGPDGEVHEGQLDSHGTAILQDLDPGTCQLSCPYADPHPVQTHVVQDGEHLSGIAAELGFNDYTVVWNRPENADLRSQRFDPHVLAPGDSLYIPELKDSPVSKPTGAKHTFTLQTSPLKLRLKLLDLGANAVAGADVTVANAPLTTDGSGIVEATVDKGAQDVPIVTSGDALDVDVGALNPPDDVTDSGWKARLYNLGFLLDPGVDDGDDELGIALEDFQAQYGLLVSGQLDDATKAQLQQIYGS